MRYVLAGVVAAGLVLAGTTLTRQDDAARAVHLTPARALEERAAVLPAPAEPAFRVGLPRLIDPNEGRARYAPVRRTVIAVTAPASGAPAVATLPPATEEGTTNVVLAVDEVRRGDGVWVKVRLPVLPNGRTGWVPREALGGYTFVRTHLVVDRSRLTATLFRDGRAVFRAPIGIGVDDAPTPAGRFYVRVKLTGFGDPFYGPVAYGTNARSAVLTDWPGGGYIGIHGTNAPELIPGRVSHGCVRLRNGDILRLSRLMSVGTPVTIR
jgi:lipoprotein-anchoring transpeptidase ErfK/SrfK